MPRTNTLTRSLTVAIAASALALGGYTPSASASEVYLGTATGSINVTGGGTKYTYTDAQYRSTSLANTRLHTIRIKTTTCGHEWRVRAAVRRGSSVDVDEKTVQGCKTALLTPIGDLRAQVTLTVRVTAGGISASTAIPNK